MASPLKHVGTRFPKQVKKIVILGQEWHEQTKTHTFPGSKEGTFDTNIVEHTRKYVKAKYTGQKLNKREAILDSWAIFEEAQANDTTVQSKASTLLPPYAGMEVFTPPPAAIGYTSPTVVEADDLPTEGVVAKPKRNETTSKQIQSSTV